MPQAEAEKQTDGQAYEEKAVTRTINLYKDGELVDTKIQTVNFHKILGTWYVKNDGVVGVKTGQFEAYDIPEQAGYTAQVNGATVNKVDNMSVTYLIIYVSLVFMRAKVRSFSEINSIMEREIWSIGGKRLLL